MTQYAVDLVLADGSHGSMAPETPMSAGLVGASGADPAQGGAHANHNVWLGIGSELAQHLTSNPRGVGRRACLVVYGQAHTGRRFTTVGTRDEPGLLPQLAAALIDSGLQVALTIVSVVGDSVYDLLGGDRRSVRVRHHPKLGAVLDDATTVALQSGDDVISMCDVAHITQGDTGLPAAAGSSFLDAGVRMLSLLVVGTTTRVDCVLMPGTRRHGGSACARNAHDGAPQSRHRRAPWRRRSRLGAAVCRSSCTCARSCARARRRRRHRRATGTTTS